MKHNKQPQNSLSEKQSRLLLWQKFSENLLMGGGRNFMECRKQQPF